MTEITLENLDAKASDVAAAFEDFKTTMKDNLKERDVLNEEKIDRIAKELGNFGEAKQRLDQLEVAMNRQASDGEKENSINEGEAEYKAAFNHYLRKGDETKLRNIENKQLAVNSEPDGGYWVTPEMSDKIVRRFFETSPIRSVASVQSISSDSLNIIIDDNEAASGGFIGEEDSRANTDAPQIGQLNIPVHEQFAQPRATQKLLDDASINVEDWLARKIADRLSRDENTAFVNGNGVNRPRGFLTLDAWAAPGVYERDAIEQIDSGSNGLFTYNGLVDLQNSLLEVYQNNAVFMTKRSNFGDILKLVDGESRPIFNLVFDKNTGVPFSIMGRPLMFADDIPVAATDSLSMVYGDFSVGYTIVDRLGIRTIRDELTDKPFIKFYTIKRTGGAVTNFESLKIQKLAA